MTNSPRPFRGGEEPHSGEGAGESGEIALPLSPALSPEGERERKARASSLASHAVTLAPLASSASTVASPLRASP